LEQQPYPSLDVIKSGLEILSLQYPQAKQTDPSPLIDSSFVKRIDQSGFIAGTLKEINSIVVASDYEWLAHLIAAVGIKTRQRLSG
jgi:hypothetical protein